MNRQTSVYLDLVRFAAAVVVMVSHLGGGRWTGGLGWQLVPFGAPAVDVFFVLSGYVIAYAVEERERDLASYAINRAARIYSVALPVLLLTAAFGAVGSVLRPDFEWGDTSFGSYLISVLFANQLWFASVQPGNNGPFWSLGYEVWYYVIFGCAAFFSGRIRLWLTAISLVVAGPRIALMLPVWLVGVAAYRFTRRTRSSSVAGGLTLLIFSTVALGALAVWQFHYAFTCAYCYLHPAYIRPLWDWRDYAADYGIGILIACNFVGFFLSARCWVAPTAFIRRPMQWIAGATFTLYLLHYPLAQFLVAVSPWKPGSWPQQAFVYGVTLTAVFVIAQLTERKKNIWRMCILYVSTALAGALRGMTSHGMRAAPPAKDR
jgi:peptidoglycan/LPS O-acetylase OafA/YrhL